MFLNFNYRITLSQLFFITVFFYSSVYIFFICSKGFSCLLETKNLHQEFMTFPNIFSFLPYLQNDPINLQPIVTVHGKAKASIVLGIPTAKRESHSYLLQTLQSLIESMDEKEKKDSLIIVYVAEAEDVDYLPALTRNITKQFGKEIMKSGLIEIISPPSSFYPDWNSVFDYPPEWFKWRTKQNLDFAFLMTYAKSRGPFYVQLEDDVISAPGAIGKMMAFAANKTNIDWFFLDFCQLGFIGKMFKSVDLPYIAQSAIMFHKDMPIDWILQSLMRMRFCNNAARNCELRDSKWIRHKPSLFQHIGTFSSLKGKLQKLKDNDFKAEEKNPTRDEQKEEVANEAVIAIRNKFLMDCLKQFYGNNITHA